MVLFATLVSGRLGQRFGFCVEKLVEIFAMLFHISTFSELLITKGGISLNIIYNLFLEWCVEAIFHQGGGGPMFFCEIYYT